MSENHRTMCIQTLISKVVLAGCPWPTHTYIYIYIQDNPIDVNVT